MRVAKEVALYNQGGIQNGLDEAESRASKVATSFITRVSASEGIKVHNADDLNDYIQINSNGVDLVNDNASIASFGESARVGKNSSSRFMMNADSLQAYDDTNAKYFEVSPDGMTYGSHTVADTSYADGKASAAQSAAISAAASDATSKANAAQANAEKVATNFIATDSKGIKVHNTNDSSNYTHIGSSGMDVYQGGDLAASFGNTRAQIGKDSAGHAVVTTAGMTIYGSDGTVELANIGYGSGNAQSGKATAPYCSLGRRTGGIGNYSVAEGYYVTASGYASHAEGYKTTASNVTSHAEGSDTVASGAQSHASGLGTIAQGPNQTAIGLANVADSSSLFVIGNGSWTANPQTGEVTYDRSNALKVDSSGNVHIKGNLYTNCSANSSSGKMMTMLKVSKSSVSSLPTTISNSNITADMEVINSVLSNPSAQTGDWTVTTSAGSAVISGSISGTTNITLYLAVPR